MIHILFFVTKEFDNKQIFERKESLDWLSFKFQQSAWKFHTVSEDETKIVDYIDNFNLCSF
jgi:hypothetical protein